MNKIEHLYILTLSSCLALLSAMATIETNIPMRGKILMFFLIGITFGGIVLINILSILYDNSRK
jgi:hypothetical protein